MSKVSLVSVPTWYNGSINGGVCIEKNEGMWFVRAGYLDRGKVDCYAKEFSIQQHPEFGQKVADYVNKVKQEKMLTALKWVGNCIFGASILAATAVGLALVTKLVLLIMVIVYSTLYLTFPVIIGYAIAESSKKQKATALLELKEYMRKNIFDQIENLECERDLTKEEKDLMNWKHPIDRLIEKIRKSMFAPRESGISGIVPGSFDFDATRPLPTLRSIDFRSFLKDASKVPIASHVEPQKRLYPIVPPSTVQAFAYP